MPFDLVCFPSRVAPHVFRRWCAFVLPLFLAGAGGCKEGDDGDDGSDGAGGTTEAMTTSDESSTGDVEVSSTASSSDSGPVDACGPTELCTRSIEECGLQWELAQCEAWYDDPTQCADFDGYVACNCDCIGEETCDDYYGCGSICFEDYC